MPELVTTAVVGYAVAHKTAVAVSVSALGIAFIGADAIWKARRDFGALDYEVNPEGVLFFHRDAISSTSAVVSLTDVYRLDIDALGALIRDKIDAKRVGRAPTKPSRAKVVAGAAKADLVKYLLSEEAKRKALPTQAKPIGLIGFDG